MVPSRRKTRRAWNEPGHAHFVTYSCVGRLPLLSRILARRWVIESLSRARRELRLALWSYAIMPERVHGVVVPRDEVYRMKDVLVALKRPVAEAARRHLEKTGQLNWLRRLTVRYPSRNVFRFWQPGGGFDRNVFRERTVGSVIEYIHANPVRRGLVRRPEEWRWSSAAYWAGVADVPHKMDQPNV